jgi:hypothetical protein
MKKVLLSLMLIGTFAFSKAQVVLNEIYTQPNLPGHQEFFELYSQSVGGAVSLDCYQLVTYFKDKDGTGFYVLDFTSTSSINYQQYFVGAATSPFSTQGPAANQNVTPNMVWTSAGLAAGGSLKRYTYDGVSGYTITDAAGTDDFFAVSTGTNPSTGVFLFENGAFVNGFMAGVNNTSIPADITNLPDLAITVNCGGVDVPKVLDLDAIIQAEFVISNAGTDNGFARTSDGKCGSWVKTSSSVNHTPKRTNGSAAGLAGALLTTQFFDCPGSVGANAGIRVNVTGTNGDATAGNTLPVSVRLYYDNPDDAGDTIGGLDDNDVFISALPYATFADGEKSFVIPYADRDKTFILVYRTSLGCFDRVVPIEGGCLPLPVKFSSFNATRSNTSSVSISWTTAQEQNSKGFYIQKNVNGVWTNVAYVPSQAVDGNSTSALNYSYVDMNSDKGITQYRVQQVDLDGKFAYTDIRAIRGEGAVGKVVLYPNPSSDGKVNVVFEDNTAIRDIIVNDMQGKVVRSFRGISNNILVIEKLTTGFYTIKVTNRITNASSVHKVVIK